MKTEKLLQSLKTESLGFRFGEPWRSSEQAVATVVPIIRSRKKNRDYITSVEAGQDLSLTNAGAIDRVNVAYFGAKPVF